MVSDNGMQVQYIETINNGDRSSSSIDFYTTQPILGITHEITIKFCNCEILSHHWNKRNGLILAGIDSTNMERLAKRSEFF